MTLDILVQVQNTLELGDLGRCNKRIFRTLHFGESESNTLTPRSCILEATQYGLTRVAGSLSYSARLLLGYLNLIYYFSFIYLLNSLFVNIFVNRDQSEERTS